MQGRRSIPLLIFAAAASRSPSFAAGAAVLDDPRAVAVDAAGRILVTCGGPRPAVLVLERAGGRLGEIGAGELADPRGIAVLGEGRIAVADPGKGRLIVFDAAGGPVRSIDLPGVRHVVADGALVYAASPGRAGVVAVDPASGKASRIDRIRIAGAAIEAPMPAGLAAGGGSLAIADPAGQRVLVIPVPAGPGSAPEARAVSAGGMEPASVALGIGGRLYAVDRGLVRGFGPGGEEIGSFRAAALRMWFEPRGLAVDAAGKVLAVDGSTRRVLAAGPDLGDAEPEVRFDPADPSSVTVAWTTFDSRPGVLLWGPTEGCAEEVRDPAPATRHLAVLRGLAPSKRYFFHAGDPVEAIPPVTPAREDLALGTQRTAYAFLSRGNFSGEYPFATLPAPGTADRACLPVIVLVYRRVAFPAGPDGKAPPDRVLDEADLETLWAEMERYRVWVWRHSHCKLDLELVRVVVDEPRDHGELGDITPRVLADIDGGLRRQGRDIDSFWNAVIVGTHGWYANYLAGPVAGSRHELGYCHVGFGHRQPPGWWWFPTHEHGHLVHSLVMCSSAGSFAFPDAPWTLPGKFGEDFSFLAHDYRQFPPRSWLLLKTSMIRTSIDADGNGVPDDDPLVPLDERRFGLNPASAGMP